MVNRKPKAEPNENRMQTKALELLRFESEFHRMEWNRMLRCTDAAFACFCFCFALFCFSSLMNAANPLRPPLSWSPRTPKPPL